MLGYGSLQEGQDSDNSSLEDDDDIDSDDERFKTDQSEEVFTVSMFLKFIIKTLYLKISKTDFNYKFCRA